MKTRKQSNSFKVVIPARYNSTRFPGKVLSLINGKTMLRHVVKKAWQSDADDNIIVATDDENVADHAKDLGVEAMITSSEHTSGTSRIREVVENKQWSADTIVVNVQGDSPLISPKSINQVATALSTNTTQIQTLATPIDTFEEFNDPNVVKVVWDSFGKALYFSRAPIPHQTGKSVWAWRHLGIYGYTVKSLRLLTDTVPMQLEVAEQLEQLRALVTGLDIGVKLAVEPHALDVDVPSDIERVEELMYQTAYNQNKLYT